MTHLRTSIKLLPSAVLQHRNCMYRTELLVPENCLLLAQLNYH